jgi:immunity protein 52 of polymorphic toxin system
MSEQPFRFNIRYEVPRRRETPAVIGAKFLDSLDALSRIDPLFANWKVLDLPAMASLPLAVARPRIATIVENNVARNKREEPEPESGYSAIGVTGNAIPSRIVTLSVDGGGWVRDEMMLNVGDFLYPTDPLIVKYGLFREALLATSAIWQPTWGSVAAFRVDYAEESIVPGAPLFPYSAFHIPWIAYLSPARAVGFPVPAEIRTEHALDGGLLFTVTEEPLDPTNPEHLRRARILAETMIAHVGYRSR